MAHRTLDRAFVCPVSNLVSHWKTRAFPVARIMRCRGSRRPRTLAPGREAIVVHDEPSAGPGTVIEEVDQRVPGTRALCYGTTASRSSTFLTPGADQAARRASSRSNHACTLPVSVTLLSETATLIRRASISALRFKAA